MVGVEPIMAVRFPPMVQCHMGCLGCLDILVIIPGWLCQLDMAAVLAVDLAVDLAAVLAVVLFAVEDDGKDTGKPLINL